MTQRQAADFKTLLSSKKNLEFLSLGQLVPNPIVPFFLDSFSGSMLGLSVVCPLDFHHLCKTAFVFNLKFMGDVSVDK
jgi:hypothetical protein